MSQLPTPSVEQFILENILGEGRRFGNFQPGASPLAGSPVQVAPRLGQPVFQDDPSVLPQQPQIGQAQQPVQQSVQQRSALSKILGGVGGFALGGVPGAVVGASGGFEGIGDRIRANRDRPRLRDEYLQALTRLSEQRTATDQGRDTGIALDNRLKMEVFEDELKIKQFEASKKRFESYKAQSGALISALEAANTPEALEKANELKQSQIDRENALTQQAQELTRFIGPEALSKIRKNNASAGASNAAAEASGALTGKRKVETRQIEQEIGDTDDPDAAAALRGLTPGQTRQIEGLEKSIIQFSDTDKDGNTIDPPPNDPRYTMIQRLRLQQVNIATQAQKKQANQPRNLNKKASDFKTSSGAIYRIED